MTKKLLFSGLAVAAAMIVLFSIPRTITIPDPSESPSPTPEIQKVVPPTLEEHIVNTAVKYGIDSGRFLATAKCESSLRPEAIGDDGWSIGLFQIHLPSHPEVTKELALDPYWATEWSAKKFKIDPTIWVCYNRLYQ